MKTKKIILIAILAAATFLRIYKLSSVPPHLTPDEASFGYNAYSILKTGKDEFGKTLPLVFQSFGDDKPGLYLYLLIPTIAVFGLTEFAVRLPNALMGVLAVYAVFLLSKELFPKKKNLPYIVSALLAFNPWHIFFSRGAWEVNTALTLILLAIYFFYRSFKNKKLLIISAGLFGMTLLAYQGAKLSAALVILALTIVYHKKLFSLPGKNLILAVVVGIVVSLPISVSIFQGRASRLGILSIVSYSRPKEQVEEQLNQGGEAPGSLPYYLFHTESFNRLQAVLGRWFHHFSLRFLFFDGDWQNVRHSAPYQGMLLLADLPMLVLGFISVIRKKERASKFILLWLVLSPLPAALTRDEVHAIRALNMSIPLTFLTAFGIDYFVTRVTKYKNFPRIASLFSISALYILSIIYFSDAYFVHLSKQRSDNWYYGYKQIVETVAPIQGNYQKVKVQQSYDQPYIYFLFYERYDPKKYQQISNFNASPYGDVGLVSKIDNIEFIDMTWPVNLGEKNILYVTNPVNVPREFLQADQVRIIRKIDYLEDKPAFTIFEAK